MLHVTWEQFVVHCVVRRCFFSSSRLVVLTKRLRRALEGGGGGGSLALGLMPLHVERQVVRPGERPLAYSALEGLGARVLAVVAGQLVGPREAPLAFWPLAVIGLLSCVYPLVSFQVRTFGVHFGATGKVAVMNPPLLQLRIVPLVVPGGLQTRRPAAALRPRRSLRRIRRWRRSSRTQRHPIRSRTPRL